MSADAPAGNAAPAGDSAPAATTDTTAAATTGATTESAPRSTADIAAQVIERAENPPEPEEHQLPAADLPAAERYTEEEALLRNFGFKRALRADGSEYTIPRSKVLSMLASGLKRGSDRWAQERTQLDSELAQLRTFRDGFAESLRGDEAQFLAYIAQHDPRYKRFLEPQQPLPQRGNGHQSQADPNEPQPDLDLGNGARTFSPQGLQKWLEWAVEQRLEQRLAPINEEREQAKQRAKAEQVQREMGERVQKQMADAQTWPNWADYSPDILKKLQDDSAQAKMRGERPRMTLREAFLEVKAERLEAAGDPNKVRQQVIGEIKQAPKSTSLTGGSELPRGDKPRSTADIARAVVERAERGR